MAHRTGRRGRGGHLGHGAVAVAFGTALVCAVSACSWGGDDPAPSGTMSGTAGSESTDETTTGGSGGGGGAGGGSPVVLSTAAQQDGNNFLEVRALFVAEMTQACGGTLCVTVVSSPSEPGDTCTYAGSDPPWSEGLLVERESVVVLIADCDGDPDPETGEEPMDDEGGGTTSEEDSGTAP